MNHLPLRQESLTSVIIVSKAGLYLENGQICLQESCK